MAIEINVQIRGANEIIKRLRSLEEKAAKRVVNKSVRVSARWMARKLRDAAPVGRTGRLRDSIVAIFKRRKGELVAFVGFAVGRTAHHLTELGTEWRYQGPRQRARERGFAKGGWRLAVFRGQSTGRVRGTLWARKTWERNGNRLLEIQRVQLLKGLRIRGA